MARYDYHPSKSGDSSEAVLDGLRESMIRQVFKNEMDSLWNSDL